MRCNKLCPQCGRTMGDYGLFRWGKLVEVGETCCTRIADPKRLGRCQRALVQVALEAEPRLF